LPQLTQQTLRRCRLIGFIARRGVAARTSASSNADGVQRHGASKPPSTMII
jgi:hypothetical protein